MPRQVLAKAEEYLGKHVNKTQITLKLDAVTRQAHVKALSRIQITAQTICAGGVEIAVRLAGDQ